MLYCSDDIESYRTGILRMKALYDEVGVKIEYRRTPSGTKLVFHRNNALRMEPPENTSIREYMTSGRIACRISNRMYLYIVCHPERSEGSFCDAGRLLFHATSFRGEAEKSSDWLICNGL